jgi:hypothetical protein
LASLSAEIGSLSAAQAGFRNSHSTADNIFILHSLINPLSKIKLNNLTYIGIIKYYVFFKYSLVTVSNPPALSLCRFNITFSISA